jgi:hypothetical protein
MVAAFRPLLNKFKRNREREQKWNKNTLALKNLQNMQE